MWESLRASAAWMHSDGHFGLTEQHVFARPKAHVASKNELAARAPDASSDLRDADHWALGEPNEGIHQNRQARRAYGCENISYVSGQVKVREVEVGDRTFKHYDAKIGAGVHPSK